MITSKWFYAAREKYRRNVNSGDGLPDMTYEQLLWLLARADGVNMFRSSQKLRLGDRRWARKVPDGMYLIVKVSDEKTDD